MKIASVALELKILKTFTASKKHQLAKLIKILNPQCFEANISKEIYQRVMTLAKTRGIVIGWEELKVDPALREETRKKIASYTKKPIKNPEKLDRAIVQLENYRKLRAVYHTADYLLSQINGEKVPDVDSVLIEATAKLNDARVSADENEFIDIGGSDKKARRLIRELMKDNSASYIPTGLKIFDERNGGIPRGTFGMIQSSSGGGKSVLANQICGNAASKGYRVCLVPLEMTGKQNVQRHISRISNVEMGLVTNTKKLSEKYIKDITKSWMQYHKQIKRAKGLLRIWAPKSDVSVEEIIFTLDPYDFDLIIIDYLGLAKGNDGDDQWRKMGASGRFCKRHADIKNNVILAVAQLSEDEKVRYSRALNEHSSLSFSWIYDKKSKENKMVEVKLPKSRNQDGRSFFLKTAFENMRFEDINDEEAAKAAQQENSATSEDKTKIKDRGKKAKSSQHKADQEKQRKNRQIVSESDFIN